MEKLSYIVRTNKKGYMMKFNFIVRATAWSDNDTWEADFIPAWFDDETKKKIREVIKQGYNRNKVAKRKKYA